MSRESLSTEQMEDLTKRLKQVVAERDKAAEKMDNTWTTCPDCWAKFNTANNACPICYANGSETTTPTIYCPSCCNIYKFSEEACPHCSELNEVKIISTETAHPKTTTKPIPEPSPVLSKKAQSLFDEIKLTNQAANLQSTSSLRCFAHDWLGTKLPPENMNRKQLYKLLLKEQEITTNLRSNLKRLESETEYVKTLAKYQERNIYASAKTMSATEIKTVENKCIAEIEGVHQLNTELTEENNEYCNLLKERADAEKWFSAYLAKYQTAKHEVLAQYLETKKHPAKGTAEEIRKLVQTDFRMALRKITALEFTITEYESLFPSLPEHVEKTDESETNALADGGRSWLSDAQFQTLSDTERNQLILDRYHRSHRKSKWQIGRDYELYIGHVFKRKGYTNIVQYGIEKKLEDLGIDIIASNTKTGKMAYIQCKCWSKKKGLPIRENTVTQLYGGAIIHMLNNNQSHQLAEYYICTSSTSSSLAKQCAAILGVEIHEDISLGEYPSIKCKDGTDAYGIPTKIYHLPIDQMYDRTHINGRNDFYATTCAEAENLGFRRAFHWHGI